MQTYCVLYYSIPGNQQATHAIRTISTIAPNTATDEMNIIIRHVADGWFAAVAEAHTQKCIMQWHSVCDSDDDMCWATA